MENTIRGGCLCGAVSFELIPPTDFLGHCHCRSCRRAHGAPFVSWTSVPHAQLRMLAGEPVWFRSSQKVQRAFCGRCGSPLLYRGDGEDRTYIAAGALEDLPDRLPTEHVSFEEKVAWLEVADRLPKFRAKGSAEITENEWIARIEADANNPRANDLYPALRAWAQGAARILEVGCGQGACAAELPEIPYVGVDISARLLDRAMQRHAAPHRLFIRGSATDLPLAAQAFDAIYSIAVWHLLEDPRLAARELARVLKRGGRFRIVTANREAWPESDDSAEMLHLHSEDEIREALASAGLDVGARETVRHWLQLDGVRP